MFHKLNRAIKLPFTDEIEEEGLPKDLVQAGRDFFEELIRNKNNRESTTLSRKFEDLINDYYPKGNEFYPTKNLVRSTAEPIIGNLYNIEIKKEHLGKIENFIYLGLQIKGEENYTKIKENIANSLKKIEEEFKIDNSKEIKELIKCIGKVKSYELPSKWKYPHVAHKNLWHCTTLFKGRTKFSDIAKTEEYKQFIQGEKVMIKLLGIVYVPESAIVMIIKVDKNIKINNTYPHVTGFIKDFAPKYSNNIMENIMKNNKIKSVYDKLMSSDGCKLDGKECLYSDSIKIDGYSYNAYVKYLEEPVDLESTMNAFEK